MYSSDSDDDCYGNIVQKLQSMKNNYKEQKDSSNPFDDSPSRTERCSAVIETDSSVTVLENASTSLDDSGEFTLDSIIANNSKKPVTRSRKKKDQPCVESLPEPRSRRKKNQTAVNGDSNAEPSAKRLTRQNSRVEVGNSNDITSCSNEIVGNSRGARGRGGRRGRRGRGRTARRDSGFLFPFGIDLSNFMQESNSQSTNNHQPSNMSQPSQSIPTYSVGNTEEYTDMSDNQGLFTKKSDDVEIIDDNDTLDENEEMSVKVYWQSSEVFKFTIRRYQKFTQIFDFFAQKEHVTHDKLFLTYKDNVLRTDDTPDSIDYNIAKFIDGGIVNQSVTHIVSKNTETSDKNGLKLKFQCQNMKKPYETVITLEDKLLSAMMKCAEHFEKPFDKLKFYFDGDLITGKSTAKDLELDDGECIDVKIIS